MLLSWRIYVLKASTPLFQRFCSPLCPLYDGPNAGGRRGLICRTCHDEWQELPELVASPGDFSMGWVEKRLSTKFYFLRFFDLAQLQKLFFILNLRIPKKVTQFRSNLFFSNPSWVRRFFLFTFFGRWEMASGTRRGEGIGLVVGEAKCKVGRGHRREVRSVGSSGGRILV